MSEINNNLQGANIANFANEVKDNARQQANQHIHPAKQQNLSEAIQDLQNIFATLDQSHDKNTVLGQTQIVAKTIETLENEPTVKKRLLNAVKEGGAAAIEETIKHPAVKPVVAAIKGYVDA